MKKIVFDLDDTLIFWEKQFISALCKTLKLYNIYDDTLIKKIDNCLDNYEKNFDYLTKELLLSYINKSCNTSLDISFIDTLLKNQEECSNKASDEIIDTLEYLSKKYELYVLSNWFASCQIGRLKKAGIYKYFKKVVGGETYLKPHTKAFLKVLSEKELKDSYMVGDNLEVDIKGSIKMGMKAIYYNYKNKDVKEDNFIIINKISDLKEIL